MQSLVLWHDVGFYCAYIDSNQYINLSKTFCDQYGPIKFRNEGVTCKQLITIYDKTDSYIILYALFTNGQIETITTNSRNELACELNYLELNANIIKIEEYFQMICMLTSTGEIIIDNKIVIVDAKLVDFKIFDTRLLVIHSDNSIHMYEITLDTVNLILSKIDLDTTISDNLPQINSVDSMQVIFYKNIGVLRLDDGEIACSSSFDVIKKTAYYTIIKIKYYDLRIYIGISELNISIIDEVHVTLSQSMESYIENFTNDTCYTLDFFGKSKEREPFTQYQYKYSYYTPGITIIVMMDDSVHTFDSEIEIFNFFDSYPNLYNRTLCSYI